MRTGLLALMGLCLTLSVRPAEAQMATGTAGNGTITVTWTRFDATMCVDGWSPVFNTPCASPNYGPTLTGYANGSDGSSGQCTMSGTGTSNGSSSCEILNLTNGVTYTIGVIAPYTDGADGDGTLNMGGGTATPTGPPGVVPGVSVSSSVTGPGQVALNVGWSAPSDGGSPITGYTAVASPGGYSCSVGGESTGCSLEGVAPGTYVVQVTATNARGTSPSASTSITTQALPTAPSSAALSLGSSDPSGALSLSASWGSAGDGGSPITGYVARLSTGAQCSWSGCEFSGLTKGMAYSVAVSAVNALGEGPATQATWSPAVPGTVLYVTVSRAGDRALRVIWGFPASDGGAALTGFSVVSTEGGEVCTTSVWSTECTVTGLSPSVGYGFSVRASNQVGAGSGSSFEWGYPSTVPSAPTGVTASVANGQTTVSFTPGDGGGETIEYFERSLSGGSWTSVGLSTSFTITGLSNGTAYTVRVRAVNTNGASEPSAAVSVTPGTVPSAPTTLVATPGNTTASITFTAASTGGYAISTYQYSLNGGAWTSAGTAASPVNLTGLLNGTTYAVQLRAVNAVGAGAASGTVSVTPRTTPGAPTSLVATPGNTTASIAFTAGGTGGSAITGYEYSLNGGAWTSAGTTTSPVSLSGLVNGTPSSVHLRAVNTAGAGTASGAVSVTPRTTPGAPTSLVATPGNTTASIAFTAGSTGGSAITDYQYSLEGGAWTSASTTSSPVSLSGLVNGTPYSVQLRAVNAAGGGTASATVSITPRTIPSAPTSLVATPGNTTASIAFTAGSNGGSAVTDYEYSLDGGAWTSASTTSSPVSLVGLANGITYSVRLRAVNVAGAGTASGAVSVTPLTTPAAPTSLVATPANTRISISFAAGADGGTAVTDYQYSLDDGSTWTSAATTTSPVSITGLTNGVTQSVRLRAINAVGAGAMSLAVSATPTPTVPTVSASVASGVLGTSATLTSGVTDDGGRSITARGFVVSPTGTNVNPTLGGSGVIVLSATGTTGALTQRVTGLERAVQYSARAFATNAEGTAYGSLVSFTTANPLTLVYDTAAPGVTETTVNLPLRGAVSATIHWGDGTESSVSSVNQLANVTHTYTTPGVYTVEVLGFVEQFGGGGFSQPNADALVAVDSFGDVGLTSLAGAFVDAINLTDVPAVLPPTVTTLNFAFAGATQVNDPDISSWNVSAVTTLEGLFTDATAFNQPLGSWDVSQVTSLAWMFLGATSFNQPLNSWSTANVTSLFGTVFGASSFNQPLGTWNTSGVTEMTSTFRDAAAFDQPLGTWSVASVVDATEMFTGAALSAPNYDALLIGWAAQAVQPAVWFDAGGASYSSAASAARASLTLVNLWTIADGGLQTFAPTLGSPSASSIAATGAALSGTVSFDGGAAILSRGFLISEQAVVPTPVHGLPGVTEVVAAGTGTGTFSAAVSGLTAGRTYVVRGYAVNSVGTAYSAITAFDTLSVTATLAGLSVTPGTLTPAFASATLSYVVAVPFAAPTVTVTPTASNADASLDVQVNGGAWTPVGSGAPSSALALTVGANTVVVRVTAQDGVTVETYTITATRAMALSDLTAYDGTQSAPSAALYAAAGITGVTTANLASMNSALALLSPEATDTLAEIQAVVDAYAVVLAAAAGGPAPTLSQLQLIGVTGVTAFNLAGVQQAIAATADDGSGVDTVTELQGVVTGAVSAFTTALQTLASYAGSGPAPALTDYATVGVTGVTADLLSVMNSALAVVPSAQSDSVPEIQGIVDAYRDVLAVAIGSPSTDPTPGQLPTSSTYATLGASTAAGLSASGLALLHDALVRLDYQFVDTIDGLETLAARVARVMTTAADGTPSPELSLADLQMLSVTGASAETLPAIRVAIAATTNDGSGVDSVTDLQSVANDAVLRYTTALQVLTDYNGTGTAPTSSDYADVGLSGVTGPLLTGVNSALAVLPTGHTDSVAELQAIVAAYQQILGEANGALPDATPGVNPTTDTYATIGALTAAAFSPAGLALLNDVIAQSDPTDVDTVAEIDALAARVQRVMTVAAGGTPVPALSLADLLALRVTGVTAETFSTISTDIAATADDGTGVDSVAELQAIVAAEAARRTAALTLLGGYDGTGPAPTVSDYTNAGVTGVTTDLLPAVNSAVAALPGTLTDSAAELQAVVAAYQQILAEANGGLPDDTPGVNPISTAYSTIGAVTAAGLSPAGLALLNDVIAQSPATSVDTVGELEALALSVSRVMTLAAGGTSTPALSAADLAALLIPGVLPDALAVIRADLAATVDDGTGVDSVAELQSVVAGGTGRFTAALQTLADYAGTGPAPTVDDFTTVGVTGMTAGLLPSVNSALAVLSSAQSDSVAELQAIVAAYQQILAEANGASADATPGVNPTATSFSTIGAVTAAGLSPAGLALLNDVIAQADATAVDTVSEIEALAAAVSRVMTVAAGGTPVPALGLADLLLLGITGVTADTLANLTADIASTTDDGTGVDSVAELLGLVRVTEISGVMLSGPATMLPGDTITLTARIVDSRGRTSVLPSSTRFRLSGGNAGAVFLPGSLLTLAAGTSTATVTFTSSTPGSVTLRMAWLLNGSDAEAPGRTPGIQMVSIDRQPQTITVAPVATQGLGDQLVPISATTTSGLSVIVTSLSTSVCSVSGGQVRLLAVGTCAVRVSQWGDAAWSAATPVDVSFAVVTPTITVAPSGTQLPGLGGTSRIALTVTPANTAWRATSSASWLTTTSAGVGSGTLEVTATANPGFSDRSATLVVGTRTVSLTQAPHVVLNLRVAEVRDGQVTLQWTYEGPTTAGFVVEGDVVPGGRSAVLPMGRVGVLSVPVGNGVYFARVRLVEDPALRMVSNEVRVVVGPLELPSAPTNLLAMADGSRLILNWINTFTGGPLTGVDLLVSGSIETLVPLGLRSSASFDNVPPGTYTLQLQATNEVGRSAVSSPVTVAVPGACVTPQTPTWVSAGMVNGAVTVRWEPAESGGAATDYLILVDGLGVFPSGGSRVVFGVPGPGTYRIAVQAVNACGRSAPSTAQTIVVP